MWVTFKLYNVPAGRGRLRGNLYIPIFLQVKEPCWSQNDRMGGPPGWPECDGKKVKFKHLWRIDPRPSAQGQYY